MKSPLSAEPGVATTITFTAPNAPPSLNTSISTVPISSLTLSLKKQSQTHK